MDTNGWPKLNSEQRKQKLDRAVIGIALELMRSDSGLTKEAAMVQARSLWGKSKSRGYPKAYREIT